MSPVTRELESLEIGFACDRVPIYMYPVHIVGGQQFSCETLKVLPHMPVGQDRRSLPPRLWTEPSHKILSYSEVSQNM